MGTRCHLQLTSFSTFFWFSIKLFEANANYFYFCQSSSQNKNMKMEKLVKWKHIPIMIFIEDRSYYTCLYHFIECVKNRGRNKKKHLHILYTFALAFAHTFLKVFKKSWAHRLLAKNNRKNSKMTRIFCSDF